MDKETMKKGNVVWLDDNTSIRALVNCSRLPDPETVTTETESSEQPETESKVRGEKYDDEEEEEGQVEQDEEEEEEEEEEEKVKKSSEEIEVKEGEVEEQKKKEDVQERRFHTRRIQRDRRRRKEKRKETRTWRRTTAWWSRDRVGERGGASRSLGAGLRGRQSRSPSPWSESDEMDYDLELKMISTPSPKKTKKMTMYADELDTTLRASGEGRPPAAGGEAERPLPRQAPPGGPRRKDRETPLPESQSETCTAGWAWPIRTEQRRQRAPLHPLFIIGEKENASSIRRGATGRRRRRGGREEKKKKKKKKKGAGEEEEEEEEEDDSALQEVWGAMIKQKQERLTTQIKKSRLDNLPSLQIEIRARAATSPTTEETFIILLFIVLFLIQTADLRPWEGGRHGRRPDI
ncbi:hypothetical protein F7725_006369 [Dissostichus mawsoni]|uniref:Nuclear cap-binding protein subunit 3 n=1 Tax=Dissostichus mawsoni TaxID=36200 RepID=A0A7J5XVF1_DISMA|nr:hypothetical protein F7725_006369 [Dissostichus mawsoni]